MSMLSGLTGSAGVVVTTKENARLKHIEFVRLDPERALAVLVAADGSIENRVVQTPRDLPASALIEAGNYLNMRIAGRTIIETKAEIEVGVCRGGGRTRRTDGTAGRRRLCELDRDKYAGATAHRPWSGQSARQSHRARRSRTHSAAFCRSRNPERCHRSLEPRRGRRRRAHLHRLREQAILVVRFIDDRGTFPRRSAAWSSACSVSSVRHGSTTRALCRWSIIRRRSSAAWCMDRRTARHGRA